MKVLSRVVEELRARCLPFNGNVAGPCEWARFYYFHEEAPGYPCGYVELENESPEENRGATGYLQSVKVNFGVIILVENEDSRGQSALEQIEDIQPHVFHSILNWTPDVQYIDPIVYEGKEYVYTDRARMAVRLDFSYFYHLDDSDTRHGDDLNDLPPYKGADVTAPVEDKYQVSGKFDVISKSKGD